ncbi:MAG: TonB-dependent receptor [Gemmatimonadota bacterium]|nr:TonB-dependent receptor [Gemmatimonadota bacterium]
MRNRISALLVLLMAGTAETPALSQEVGDRRGLAGAVLDIKRSPLGGVQLVLAPGGRRAVTDAEGRFVFRELPPGRYRLQAALVGYTSGVQAVQLPDSGARAEVELILESTPLALPGIEGAASIAAQYPGVVAQAMTQLGGKALEREMAGTIAETLASQPGIAVRYNGPAAAVPVIRGLTGDRILILQDGVRTADLAGSADDHAVTIDPLVAQRIEVVRGPATLLYGNNALGGVVNVISNDIPAHIPGRLEGTAAAQTESAFPGGGATLRASAPLGERLALTLRAGGRSTGPVRIGDDPLLGNRLANTHAWNRDGALGLGYVGDRVTGGGSLKAYDFAYGLPLPPGSDPVSLRGRRFEGSGRVEVDFRSGILPTLRLDAATHDYAHDELDGAGDLQMAFALRTQTMNLLLRQGAIGPLTDGAWGVSGLFKEYASTGPAALTPAADSRAFGVFGFQEVAPWVNGPALQLGGRFDQYGITSHSSAKFGPGVERAFRALSGSVGVRIPVGEGISGSLNVARSFRAPTVEELFSAAPHAGTGSVEFGNALLNPERGRGMEGVLRIQKRWWTGQFAVYRNAIANYVYLAAAGDTVIGGVPLPVFTYAQNDAVLRGAEGSLEWAARDDLVLGLSGDLLHAWQGDGTPLSFMPPARIGGLLRWERGAISLGGDAHHEFPQRRVGAADERPTDAHTVIRLHAGFRLQHWGLVHSVSIRGENLTDSLHREATSRIKDFAPNPGRNLAIIYRVLF